MPTSDPLEEGHRRRSNFVRGLVQRTIDDSGVTLSELASKPPQRIVQFWDDLNRLPGDVGECIATWKKAEKQGFERLLFDKHQAGEFIHQRLGQRYKDAYNKCYHPAMQSDYFRLCYILVEGGCYIDADDVFNEAPIQHLCGDGRLKLQPLCYDVTTNMMVPPSLFTRPGADASGWIFYFNMNPLIAGSRHPLIDRALAQATLTHVNKTARIQTVASTTNQNLYNLLVAFKAHTGYGVLCNTSLNFKGKGFINRIDDLSSYVIEQNLDGFVVDGRSHILKSSKRYQAYLSLK